MLEHSIDETIDTLDACDRKAYRSLVEPIVSNFMLCCLKRFSVPSYISQEVHSYWRDLVYQLYCRLFLWLAPTLRENEARSLFAGVSTHSVLPLETIASAAVGLTMLAAGHTKGWPILRGGAQSLHGCPCSALGKSRRPSLIGT